MQRRSNGNAIVRTRLGMGKKRARTISISKKNIHICVTVLLYREESFYEQARKAVYFPVKSNKVSGKSPATLFPFTQNGKGKRRSS